MAVALRSKQGKLGSWCVAQLTPRFIWGEFAPGFSFSAHALKLKETIKCLAAVRLCMGRHTRTGFEPTPAIVRTPTEDDRETRVLHTPRDSVSFVRGIGDSGKRIQVVEMFCPADYCGFDRMIRKWNVRPEERDTVRYWCLNPNCAHYVDSHLSHACHGSYPQCDTDEPVVWEGAP